MTCLPFAFIDGVGAPEMLLIFVLVLVLFGGQKLPEFARGLGKTLRELKKAAAGVEDEFKRALEEDERKQQAAALADQSQAAQGATTDAVGTQAGPGTAHDAHHDHGYYDQDYHHGGENQDGTQGQPAETTAASGDPAGPVAEKSEATTAPAPTTADSATATPESVPPPATPAQPATPSTPPAPDGQAPKAP